MTKSAWAWVWFAFLLALDIAIPWFVLTNVEKMSGAFLFWTIWVLSPARRGLRKNWTCC